MKIGDQVFRAVLDTGATLSIVARRLLKTFKKTKTVAIRVGDGVVVCFLGTRLHSCASFLLKIRNPKSQSTNLAGSLDGAPIITQSRRHKPCSKIEVSYSAHSQLAFDASLLFTDCQRDCDCNLRAVALLRCAVALLLFEAITLPPR